MLCRVAGEGTWLYAMYRRSDSARNSYDFMVGN